jgi:hypothetical protein
VCGHRQVTELPVSMHSITQAVKVHLRMRRSRRQVQQCSKCVWKSVLIHLNNRGLAATSHHQNEFRYSSLLHLQGCKAASQNRFASRQNVLLVILVIQECSQLVCSCGVGTVMDPDMLLCGSDCSTNTGCCTSCYSHSVNCIFWPFFFTMQLYARCKTKMLHFRASFNACMFDTCRH